MLRRIRNFKCSKNIFKYQFTVSATKVDTDCKIRLTVVHDLKPKNRYNVY